MTKLLVTYGLHKNEYEITKPVGEGLSKEKIPSTKVFDLRHNKKINNIFTRNSPSIVVDIHASDGFVPEDWKEDGVKDMVSFLTEDKKSRKIFEKYIFSNKPSALGVIGCVVGPMEVAPDKWTRGVNLVDKLCLKMDIPYTAVELSRENKNDDVVRYLSGALNLLVDSYGCKI